MAVKKTKWKAHENRTKECLRIGVRSSGETNSPPGYPGLHRAGSGEGEKTYKEEPKLSGWPRSSSHLLGWPSCLELPWWLRG